jgi:aminoglycoside/choline kinase family phosphotransferase
VLNHFKKNSILVPEVKAKSPEHGFVLLEDLGDLTLERKFWENQNQSLAEPFYRQTIDELVKIHYAATSDRSPCTAFNVQFDTEKLLWELNYAKTNLLEGVCKIQFTKPELDLLRTTFTDICETLHREPKFIAHRDFHSRNVMIKLGKTRIIDFQDARMGPIQYDLVSLLRDSYVNLDEELAQRLINYYLSKRADFGLDKIPQDKFFDIYELQTIQRCFKACGSFASFYMAREDRRYLKYISKTLQTVKHSLDLFPKYKGFAQILEDKGVLSKSYESL